jgi:hypothetical protein
MLVQRDKPAHGSNGLVPIGVTCAGNLGGDNKLTLCSNNSESVSWFPPQMNGGKFFGLFQGNTRPETGPDDYDVIGVDAEVGCRRRSCRSDCEDRCWPFGHDGLGRKRARSAE